MVVSLKHQFLKHWKWDIDLVVMVDFLMNWENLKILVLLLLLKMSLMACVHHPPGTKMKSFSTYEIVKPIPNVLSGPSAPHFGELGLGKQHQLPMTIQDYLEQGYIHLIDRNTPKKF